MKKSDEINRIIREKKSELEIHRFNVTIAVLIILAILIFLNSKLILIKLPIIDNTLISSTLSVIALLWGFSVTQFLMLSTSSSTAVVEFFKKHPKLFIRYKQYYEENSYLAICAILCLIVSLNIQCNNFSIFALAVSLGSLFLQTRLLLVSKHLLDYTIKEKD